MNSVLNKVEKERKDLEYPILMESSENKGLVVLFCEWEEGFVVASDEKNVHALGKYSCSWYMPCFSPLEEGDTVTLSN